MFSNSFAKTGKGELKLSKYTMETLMMYMYGRANPKWSDGVDKKNKPMLMTVSEDGKSSHYYYCPYTECQTGNYVYKSIKACEKGSNGSPCYLFATKRRIKWKNSINTKYTNISSKLLKEPYEIAKIIQDLGFYDGDITELPGIDYKTGALDDSANITGQTVTNIETTKKKEETKKTVKKYELKGERSIALSWEGYEELIIGTVGYEESDDGKTSLSLDLPNNEGSCEGTYLLQNGGKGTWLVACSNEMGAAGTLKWDNDGGVTGSGRDYKDRKVKFAVAKRS